MHPAYSVIFFTVASGAGYGLLFWLSLATLVGAMPGGRWLMVAGMLLALALVTFGLLSSARHLGHPERALGAFSQWRSSWLSREAVAAAATYVPAGLLLLLAAFGGASALASFAALLIALGAAVTVYCTARIYASLRTIRHWNRKDVVWIYLALAVASGGLLFCLLLALGGHWLGLAGPLALVALLAAALLKARYWAAVDADPGAYTVEMALGMPDLGTPRPLDPPHTMPNFVMREMGYSVGRKHAVKLRRGVLLALFAVPAVLLALSLLTGGAAPLLVLGVLSAAGGLLVERWLFFAEAEHVSQLYYGLQRA